VTTLDQFIAARSERRPARATVNGRRKAATSATVVHPGDIVEWAEGGVWMRVVVAHAPAPAAVEGARV
jgi:hypothetical protein